MSGAMRHLRSQAPTSNSAMLPTIEITAEHPSTPPRGRARYPDSLTRDPGRVPLHRRGTSNTYERLEDLLREAGYKETRIFTPEAERAEARAQVEERRGSTGGSVGAAVAGFLSGWLSSAKPGETGRASSEMRQQRTPEPRPEHEDMARWSLPPSPLAHKSTLPGSPRPRSTQSPSHSASSTTIASMHSYASSSLNGRTVSYRPHGALRPQSSAASNLRTYAQVSAARGYLRHMASAPNMPKRCPSTSANSVERRSVLNASELPALPARWLETVTKAVLGSANAGAHVGGPARGTFTLADTTNRPQRAGRSASGVPSGLSTYLRVESATSAVSTTRVMCRSAPASRSSSRVGERGARGPLRDERTRLSKGKGPRGSTGGVPMLASTVVENDAWAVQWMDGRRVVVGAAREEELDDPDVDEDDEDGELDFARLLLPSKRQYSIQSLRRHLHHSHHEPGGQAGPWEDGGDGGPRSRGLSRRGSMDEADHLLQWEAMGVPGLDKGRMRRRRGIPGGWGNRAGG